MSSHVVFREERIKTVSNYELSTLVQHSYINFEYTFLVIWILKEVKWSWIIKLEKKDFSGLAVLKSFFCVCEKWSVIFVISKFFFADQYSQTIGNCWWPTVICNAVTAHTLWLQKKKLSIKLFFYRIYTFVKFFS